MTVVLDCSVALANAFKDERTPAVQATMRQVAVGGAFVPSPWRLEVANVLQLAVRKRRITAEDRDATLADLWLLPIEIDAETDARAWSSTLRLADRHGLTLYDAAYLELADRRGLPLASLDKALCAAAKTMGVPLC